MLSKLYSAADHPQKNNPTLDKKYEIGVFWHLIEKRINAQKNG